MILKDITLNSPEENLLYDDVLLQLAEQGDGGEVLRFWESSTVFIVLGRIGKKERDVNEENAKKDDIKVYRRSSGGGTVVQGPGCLNFSFILSKDKHPGLNDINKSYQYILSKVIEGLHRLKIDCRFFPISDIALAMDQKKFSGNAQKRSRNFILHHGTILYNFDLKLIAQYLNMPEDKPQYRQDRPHLDFVDNIRIDKEDFKEQLAKIWAVSQRQDELNQREEKMLKEFVDTRIIEIV